MTLERFETLAKFLKMLWQRKPMHASYRTVVEFLLSSSIGTQDNALVETTLDLLAFDHALAAHQPTNHYSYLLIGLCRN
jgi:hypothetical protein